MAVSGSKRTIQAVSDQSSESARQRVAITGDNGRPIVRPAISRSAVEQLPSEVFTNVVRFLDLRAYQSLFAVCKQFKSVTEEIKPLSPDFLGRIDIDRFIGYGDRSEEEARLLEERFESAFLSLKAGTLDQLVQLGARTSVRHLRLDVSLGAEEFADVLLQLDAAVGNRPMGPDGAQPSCKLMLDVEFVECRGVEKLARLRSAFENFRYLKVIAINVNDNLQWLKLTHVMPALQKLVLSLGTHLPLNRLEEVLGSRKEALQWIHIDGWSPSDETQRALPLFEALERLGVAHVCLTRYDWRSLADWSRCKVQTLELIEDFEEAHETRAVNYLLTHDVAFRELILRDASEKKTSTVSLNDIARALKENSGLERLELALSRTAQEEALLEAVLENRNLRFVRIPYPSELQKHVDRVMSLDQGLTITRGNDYRRADERLQRICQKLEDSLSKRALPAHT